MIITRKICTTVSSAVASLPRPAGQSPRKKARTQPCSFVATCLACHYLCATVGHICTNCDPRPRDKYTNVRDSSEEAIQRRCKANAHWQQLQRLLQGANTSNYPPTAPKNDNPAAAPDNESASNDDADNTATTIANFQPR